MGPKNKKSITTPYPLKPTPGQLFFLKIPNVFKSFFLSLARSNIIHRQQPFCTAKNHFDNAWIEKCALGEREGERKIGFHFVCKVSGVDVIFCSKGILWFNFLHTLGPDGKYYLSLFPRLRLVIVKSVAPS